MRHLAEHVRQSDKDASAEHFLERAATAQRRADLVRKAVMEVEERTSAAAGFAESSDE